jgi:hypothetical protein
VQGVLRTLDREQRLAGLAAIGLLATLFLPWYEATLVAVDRGVAVNPTFSAFQVFSFVEAAVLVVALGVFALLFARGERRAFHLPGGDGTVVLGAGTWAAVLLLWRVFDRPDVEGAVQVGITWGFFFAFIAAAALAGAGWRMRAAGRPEPPNPAADGSPQTAPAPTARHRPAAGEQLTIPEAPPAAGADLPEPPRPPDPPASRPR